MKSPDKFLIGIVIGVVVLLAVVFGVILTRPEVDYLPEDTPEGVAHNYLLALQKEDYQRAYKYLDPHLEGYPKTLNAFKRDVGRNRWEFRSGESISLDVQSSAYQGENIAYVDVRETHFYTGELFSSSQSTSTFEMYLVLDSSTSEWKIADSDFYFAWCWNNKTGCR